MTLETYILIAAQLSKSVIKSGKTPHKKKQTRAKQNEGAPEGADEGKRTQGNRRVCCYLLQRKFERLVTFN